MGLLTLSFASAKVQLFSELPNVFLGFFQAAAVFYEKAIWPHGLSPRSAHAALQNAPRPSVALPTGLRPGISSLSPVKTGIGGGFAPTDRRRTVDRQSGGAAIAPTRAIPPGAPESGSAVRGLQRHTRQTRETGNSAPSPPRTKNPRKGRTIPPFSGISLWYSGRCPRIVRVRPDGPLRYAKTMCRFFCGNAAFQRRRNFSRRLPALSVSCNSF